MDHEPIPPPLTIDAAVAHHRRCFAEHGWCGMQRPPGAPATAGTTQAGASTALLQQLQAQIGDAACDNSAQCRTLAVGSKPCGGPDRYLPWSTKRTDGVTLGKLAAQYAAARQIENRKSDLMSTCELVTDPGAICQQQRCVLQPRGPGAGGPPVL